MDLQRFKKLPLMGILHGITLNQLIPVIETAISAGLETIEITMNTPCAAELIQAAVKFAQGRLMIGAGTVLSLQSLKTALTAGATFIVMPTVVNDVAMCCKKHKIPFFPGALTPQEIHTAWQTGATMVKVFPAKFFGPEYFREFLERRKAVSCPICRNKSGRAVRNHERSVVIELFSPLHFLAAFGRRRVIQNPNRLWDRKMFSGEAFSARLKK